MYCYVSFREVLYIYIYTKYNAGHTGRERQVAKIHLSGKRDFRTMQPNDDCSEGQAKCVLTRAQQSEKSRKSQDHHPH